MLRTVFILGSIVLHASVSVAQTTWHVDAGATPPGNGSSLQPYADLQFALAQPTTVSGDTLLVEPGSYNGPIDFLGKDVAVRSTVGAFATILEGNGQLISVVNFVSGEGPGAVLDGFTIRGGFGTAAVGTNRAGGGLRCDHASPTLLNLQIEYNSAYIGSGASLVTSSAHISNCVFNWNDDGPALSTDSASSALVEFCVFEFNGGNFNPDAGGFHGRATLRDCVFRANVSGASSLGASFVRCTFEANQKWGLRGLGSGPTSATQADQCLFSGNLGGGATNFPTGIVVIRDSVLRGNRAGQGGAAYLCQLIDCLIEENVASSTGGGVHWGQAIRCRFRANRVLAPVGPANSFYGGGAAFGADLSDCELVDNIVEPPPSGLPSSVFSTGGGALRGTATGTRFVRNRAQIGGGASGSVLANCTLYANVADLYGGSMVGVAPGGSSVYNLFAKNVIARAGVPDEVGAQGVSVAVVTYSNVQGGYAGVGNFDLDPLFFAPQSGDFHLKPGSPCIDAGDPASPLDPDGSIADVGAYRFDANYCSTPGTWCADKPNSLGCVPEMGSTGTPSASGADNFFVTGSNFLGSTFGLLAWSRTPDSIPFQNGTLCLQGPFFRAGLQVSSGSFGACDGTYSFHFSQSYRALFGINTLDTIYAQWFARDALNPDGTGWSLSNALEFTVCP